MRVHPSTLFCLAVLVGCGRIDYLPGRLQDGGELSALDAPVTDAARMDGAVDGATEDAPLDATSPLDAPRVDGGDDTACGDGIVENGEQCDDGNVADGDGCSAVCLVTAGFVCNGEPSRCDFSCGDGVLALAHGEECDDGNLTAGDGCARCMMEPGYTCNRGQPTRFVARRGRRDCQTSTVMPRDIGEILHLGAATARVRHAAGAHDFGRDRWTATVRATPWHAAEMSSTTQVVPRDTWSSDDQVSRATAIAFVSGKTVDVRTPDTHTLSLGIWDAACSDNSDDVSIWRIDRPSSCAPAPRGLLSWLPLDESLLDALRPRAALVPAGSQTYVQGIHGWALRLGESADLDTSAFTQPSYTLALWLMGELAAESTPVLRVMSSDVVAMGISDPSVRLTVNFGSPIEAVVSRAEPHHLAIVMEVVTSPRVLVYVDGALLAASAALLAPIPLGDTLRLYSGYGLDDVRIYDHALDASEIATLATR